ncbi:MAG: hypothetical protein H6Q74_3159 [Firmicutes bacterium]|nr:hypothetical protein [Bacillota bacterium]
MRKVVLLMLTMFVMSFVITVNAQTVQSNWSSADRQMLSGAPAPDPVPPGNEPQLEPQPQPNDQQRHHQPEPEPAPPPPPDNGF